MLSLFKINGFLTTWKNLVLHIDKMHWPDIGRNFWKLKNALLPHHINDQPELEGWKTLKKSCFLKHKWKKLLCNFSKYLCLIVSLFWLRKNRWVHRTLCHACFQIFTYPDKQLQVSDRQQICEPNPFPPCPLAFFSIELEFFFLHLASYVLTNVEVLWLPF